MCGRYAFYQVDTLPSYSSVTRLTTLQRPSAVREQLEASNMPIDEAPSDDAVRTSYNFAPGYNGLIYRADVPDFGSGPRRDDKEGQKDKGETDVKYEDDEWPGKEKTHYKLQSMKWGTCLEDSTLL
jgi:hypothetical protein